MTDKPFSTDKLNLRLAQYTGQTAMRMTAPISKLKNLPANFEFHGGTLNFAPGFRNR